VVETKRERELTQKSLFVDTELLIYAWGEGEGTGRCSPGAGEDRTCNANFISWNQCVQAGILHIVYQPEMRKTYWVHMYVVHGVLLRVLYSKA